MTQLMRDHQIVTKNNLCSGEKKGEKIKMPKLIVV